MKPAVVIGLLGTNLDSGLSAKRWERWRPTVSLCQHPDFLVRRLELLHRENDQPLVAQLREDIARVSPETQLVSHLVSCPDFWDFEAVYDVLYRFARAYPFHPEEEEYFVHITTGTHVAQICLFLLTESRHFPARLLQTSPAPRAHPDKPGGIEVIDLDLTKYDRLAARFLDERSERVSFLKAGIPTGNPGFNRLIEELEIVALRSRDPILLTGPTGAGKSGLARRVYQLKQKERQVEGPLVEVNCATLRGDAAMATLFGHEKGAFTGALQAREGLLRAARGGLLFLDEIGELGLDEQAMLLRALEEKKFLPLGSDREAESDFQLIAGTNRDLRHEVQRGRFREDLLARIEVWSFVLPGLKHRPEDIEPNLGFELDQQTARQGRRVTMSREARERFLAFAIDPATPWTGNFRDLIAAVTRMATLAPGGRITPATVEEEIARLERSWAPVATRGPAAGPVSPPAPELPPGIRDIDHFDAVQLAEVLRVCRASPNLSAAGRKLFAVSRGQKSRPNDADRLRKYLARFGLTWEGVHGLTGPR